MTKVARLSPRNSTSASEGLAKKHKHPAPTPASTSFHSPSCFDQKIVRRKAACACGGGCLRCAAESHHQNPQTKLAVSSPGDQYEQEADLVAEQVTRMPAHE